MPCFMRDTRHERSLEFVARRKRRVYRDPVRRGNASRWHDDLGNAVYKDGQPVRLRLPFTAFPDDAPVTCGAPTLSGGSCSLGATVGSVRIAGTMMAAERSCVVDRVRAQDTRFHIVRSAQVVCASVLACSWAAPAAPQALTLDGKPSPAGDVQISRWADDGNSDALPWKGTPYNRLAGTSASITKTHRSDPLAGLVLHPAVPRCDGAPTSVMALPKSDDYPSRSNRGARRLLARRTFPK